MNDREIEKLAKEKGVGFVLGIAIIGLLFALAFHLVLMPYLLIFVLSIFNISLGMFQAVGLWVLAVIVGSLFRGSK